MICDEERTSESGNAARYFGKTGVRIEISAGNVQRIMRPHVLLA
jgi:hypothetical protein